MLADRGYAGGLECSLSAEPAHMSDTQIRQQIDGPVVTITLARPQVHNAFDDALIAELTGAFAALADSSHLRVVVLAGEGKSFCAGADLHWMRRMVDYARDDNLRDAQALADLLLAIRNCPKPVVARVHGAAMGGGAGLVAACDIAVASATASFAFSEVKLGLIPAVIAPFVVERIGASAARRYLLTAERFDAAEAHRMGLVAEVAPDDATLDERLASIGTALAGNGPAALARCKQLLSAASPLPAEPLTEFTVNAIAECRVSDEAQEGMRAFLEKREPTWRQTP